MKIRVWRILGNQQYQDVEVNSREEAEKFYIDYEKNFTTTQMGLIKDCWLQELEGDGK